MAIPVWLERSYYLVTDAVFARVRQVRPSAERLAQCKLFSHRGVYDNHTIYENTLAAFAAARDAGAFGVECDLRWSKDLVPMIFHDANFKRLFKDERNLADMTFSQVRADYPMIPTLDEVVVNIAPHSHLMLELKKEPYPQPDTQKSILKEILAPLKPVDDYHCISLSPEMLLMMDFVPSQALLPIAVLNVKQCSEIVRERNYGGLLGHYTFLHKRAIKQQLENGKHVGTGQVVSKKCLYRELNRGVDWVFSDNVELLSSILLDRISKGV